VTLAAQRFIDVVFESRTNADIDPATINGDELTLSNAAGQTGLLDAQVLSGAPMQIGKNTYRYFLIDRNPGDSVPLFSGAEVVERITRRSRADQNEHSAATLQRASLRSPLTQARLQI